MKTKKLATAEKYSAVAVRAKLSVEVEQRKRLGAWAKRVLVLDGATLYAYKTKGDGGSVGGWAIGGADVHVRRGGDSNREDGRHILVIARPPAYKLVFAFTTTYEQARMIQALSSSGATVTGLDAIMLLKNLRQQQEQEQNEQEERKKEQEAKDSQEDSHDENGTVTSEEDEDSDDEGQKKKKVITNGSEELSVERDESEEEIKEIDESIYDQNSSMVSNPLYSSAINLSSGTAKDQVDGDDAFSSISSSSSTYRDTSTSEASDDTVIPASPEASGEKVNPLPKPPRASVSEGSPASEAPVPETGSNSLDHHQSGLNSDSGQEDVRAYLHSSSIETKGQEGPEDLFGEISAASEGRLTEAKNRLYSASDDDSEEGEGYYQVNPHPEDNESNSHYRSTSVDEEEANEEEVPDSENYVVLLSKMKLERGLSIESQSVDPYLDAESPEGVRKLLGDSPLGDASVKTTSPVQEFEGERENKVRSRTPDDTLSDSDEKFEQLYQELSGKVSLDASTDGQADDAAQQNKQSEIDSKDVENGKDQTSEEREKEDNTSDLTNGSSASQEGAPLHRVNSIIKKKGSVSSGKPKRVQFDLHSTTTIEPNSSSPHGFVLSPKDEREEIEAENEQTLLSPKKTKNESTSPTKKKSEGPTSPTTPTKKKGIFSSIFSASSKKTQDTSPPKEDVSSKKDTLQAKVAPKEDVSNKKDTPQTKVAPKEDVSSKKDTPQTKVAPKEDVSSKKDTPQAKVAPKEDVSSKKDTPQSKVDTITKTTPITSQMKLKRQPTVDITAPLIIGGPVEMGGSINGKVSPRRLEVRDSHVLAFMPKATSPTSRLSLTGLSVTPVIGSIHTNALSLTRASRCMMVVKLTSREDMMRWINVLSDEVIKATPENQRTGLVLYPSPKKQEPEVTEEHSSSNDSNDDDEKPAEDKGQKEIINKLAARGIRIVGKKTEAEKKPGLMNGHNTKERAEVSTSQKRSEINKSPHTTRNGGVTDSGENEQSEDGEDTTDFWRKKKVATVEEYEMNILPKAVINRASDTKVPAKKPDGLKAPSANQSDLKVVDEHYKEDKGGEKPRKINKLNIEERWKEHKEPQKMPDKRDSQVHKINTDKKNRHTPLRRLSYQENTFSHLRAEGQDTVGNLLFLNDPPRRDYHANCIPPSERLSNHSRVLSSSESNLRRDFDSKPTSNIRRLQRFGSEMTLQQKPRKEFNNKTMNGTKDNSSVLISSRIIRNQGRMSTPSPTDSPSRSRSRESLIIKPKEIDIIESQEPRKPATPEKEIIKTPKETEKRYEEEVESHEEISESENEKTSDLPGITWSVAATREKFELLCSVSGENKTGKLTTKTPISRKRSTRNSLMKRRSIENSAGRRNNSRRSVRRALHATNSNDSSISITSSGTDTLSRAHQGTVSPQKESFRDSVSPSLPTYATNTSVKLGEDDFKLQPVRDRRKNFERDTVDSTDSELYKSTSTDSISDPLHDIEEPNSPIKSPLRRTKNILYDTGSSSSSPEPGTITSKMINGRPKGNIPESDKGIVSRSLRTEKQEDADRNADVVICWKGPYIAQESDTGQISEQNAEHPRRSRMDLKETEQAVLSNISNAFLAKRRLLTREVAVARIQEKLSAIEENIWEIQANMAEVDNKPSFVNNKAASNWKAMEKSLKAAEEEMTYWTARLTQTQKEADQAREKLAAALVTGLAQYNTSIDQTDPQQQQQQQQHPFLKRGGDKNGHDSESLMDEEEDSFA